ncbi:MAG: ABC transporter ATP-binding protein [Planctomycetota bacterium]|jgi:ABC-2 type transport system ATP-binding protein|nr:ABC transporter ATP-binding protein [Planctomycetota bacterium]
MDLVDHGDVPALEVQRLGKRFGATTILEQVNFRLEPGQVLGLLGPNGAGKTTLLRCITGAIRPDFGRCMVFGHDSARAPGAAQVRFGYQCDMPPLEPELRSREHLQLHARLRGLPRRSREARIDEVLDLVDLRAKQRHLVSQLSRGQRSRLALAEALLHRPPLLILDEPASGLDPAQVVLLRKLLRRLAGEHSILVATHHLGEAEAVCDELVVLVAGRVRYQGSPKDLAGEQRLEQAYLEMAGAGA